MYIFENTLLKMNKTLLINIFSCWWINIIDKLFYATYIISQWWQEREDIYTIIIMALIINY